MKINFDPMSDRFTDIHHHLAYGVDDGPGFLQETELMIRAAIRDRIGMIIATPHVAPGMEAFDLESYLQKLEEMRLLCLRQQLEIEILPGAEIFYTEFTRRFLSERLIPTLADTEYILVEFSPEVTYQVVRSAVETLNRSGYIPILAHVERYRCLVKRPQRAYELKAKLDVRYQMNCWTVIKGKGFSVNRFCKRLLRDEMIDAVATDAHNVDTRPALMSRAYQALEKGVGPQYAAYLTGVDGGILFR